MDKKLNPLDGEIDLLGDTVSDIIRKPNPLTGRLELVYSADTYIQKINPFIGDFDMVGGIGASYIIKEATGNGYINLTNAIANHLMQLKAYGGTEQRNIPSGYTQLEYVTNGTNTKINTGITINNTKSYEFEIRTKAVNNSYYLLQNRDEVGANIFGIAGANVRSKIALSWTEASVSSTITRTLGNILYIKGTVNNGNLTLYVKDETDGTEDTQTGTYTTFTTPTTPIYLWGNMVNYINDGASVYYVRIKVDGELVLDYIPATDGTDIGFYDKVSGTLVTATAGTIEAGPTVTPTPTNPIDIVSNNGVLKLSPNLIDMNDSNIVVGKYIDNNGVVRNSTPNFYNSKYIPVQGGEIYTWSASSSVNYYSVMEYDSSKTFIKRTLFGSSGTPAGTSNNITLDNDTAYILYGSNINGNDLTLSDIQAINWQIEKGSTATNYKNYGIYVDGTTETVEDELSNTATAEMLLKIGDYADEQEILSGNVIRKIGIKVLDGTENWTKESSALGNVYNVDILDNSMFSWLVCTHFKNDTPLTDNIIYKSAGSSILQIRYDTATSLAEFKNFLSTEYVNGTPIIVLYALETETTETVAGQTMNIQAGSNTIEITQASIDNLGLYAKYKATA